MKRLNAVVFAINYRSFVVVALFLVLSVLGVDGSANSMHEEEAQTLVRPNILWIIGDDLGTDLGCYGKPLVRTPNIDRLARQGARFTKAFTTAPVCSPSRSALITGMYQTAIGAQDHRMRPGDNITLPRDVKLITDYFRQAGYFTANVTTPAPGIKVAGKTDFNFTAARPFDGTDWNQRRPGQPFYAQVNFFEPHRSTPGGYTLQPVRRQKHPIDPAKVVLPPYYPDMPVVRQDWADYLNAVQLLDAKVGLVLDRLDREGLSGNTIVMFFSDNGRPQVRGKVWLYDSGINVPLIVRYPGYLKPNTVREELVSGIDIAATSLDLAGIKLPQNMQGQIFTGKNATKRKYVFAARDRCGEAIDRVRAVRTARYKYIRNFHPETPYAQPHNYIDTSYPTMSVLRTLYAEGKLNPVQKLFMQSRKPVEEFYDTAVDPYEVNNLATSPKHQKVLKDLRVKLEEWMKEANHTVR